MLSWPYERHLDQIFIFCLCGFILKCHSIYWWLAWQWTHKPLSHVTNDWRNTLQISTRDFASFRKWRNVVTSVVAGMTGHLPASLLFDQQWHILSTSLTLVCVCPTNFGNRSIELEKFSLAMNAESNLFLLWFCLNISVIGFVHTLVKRPAPFPQPIIS